MDDKTAMLLSRMTSTFYARVADSFSSTRQQPWPGWRRVLRETDLLQRRKPCVLDLACGNLRFERFLAEERLHAGRVPDLQVHAFDSCDELAMDDRVEGLELDYAHLDVVELLYSGEDLAGALGGPIYDLAVSFAFLHHLPLFEQRVQVLQALVASVVPGGFVAVSLWQLSRSERLLAKARSVTCRATADLGLERLAPGDYLLDWQGRTDVLRYCHDFAEAEIDELAAVVAPHAQEVARFSADGSTADMNRYLILRVAPRA